MSRGTIAKLRTVDRRRILGSDREADGETMSRVDAAIRIATGLLDL